MTTDTATTDTNRLTRLLGFLARDPGNLRLLQEALSLVIASGDSQQARQLIEHIEAHPIEDATVWAQMAHLQLLLRNFAAAGEYGDKAIQAGISHPAVLLNTAYGHFYSGHYDTCAAILAKLTAQDDASADTLILHARALHHLALPEQAEPLVMRALQRDPEHVEAKGLLALLLHERDRNDTALHLAHEVLAHDPNQLDALLACGSVHVEQSNMAAARKAWRHTVAVHPTCGRAWSGLAQVEFHELEFADAEEHLKTAVTYMPDHIGTWHLLAWIYILRGDSAQARSALEQSYALDRTFGETHGGLAVVDVLDGKLEAAQLGIRRALKLNPDGMSARYAEMLMLQKAGKPEEAQALVQQVLDRQAPGSSQSGRMLMERWLQDHQGKSPRSSSGQH
ncbi:MAG: tetratricopeptide repeat protein [Pseudomonadota bacterium]